MSRDATASGKTGALAMAVPREGAGGSVVLQKPGPPEKPAESGKPRTARKSRRPAAGRPEARRRVNRPPSPPARSPPVPLRIRHLRRRIRPIWPPSLTTPRSPIPPRLRALRKLIRKARFPDRRTRRGSRTALRRAHGPRLDRRATRPARWLAPRRRNRPAKSPEGRQSGAPASQAAKEAAPGPTESKEDPVFRAVPRHGGL